LKEVYERKVEQVFTIKPAKSQEMAAKRGPLEQVQTVGIYVLTLNKEMLVRHFELVMVADTKRVSM
jgi:hypothetical protein